MLPTVKARVVVLSIVIVAIAQGKTNASEAYKRNFDLVAGVTLDHTYFCFQSGKCLSSA